jgi:hypothetical protein
MQDVRFRIQDAGYRIQDTGYRIQDTELRYARVKTLAPMIFRGYRAPKRHRSKLCPDDFSGIQDANTELRFLGVNSAPSHRGFRIQVVGQETVK